MNRGNLLMVPDLDAPGDNSRLFEPGSFRVTMYAWSLFHRTFHVLELLKLRSTHVTNPEEIVLEGGKNKIRRGEQTQFTKGATVPAECATLFIRVPLIVPGKVLRH